MEKQLVLLEVESRPAPIVPPGFYCGRPRPGYYSREVLIAVTNKLLPEIMAWGSFDDNEESEIGEQILKAVEDGEEDGYTMGQYLARRFHWDPDFELTQILHGADFHGCHKQAVQAWISDNDVRPAFEVGREVIVRILREPDYAGKIRSVTDDGMYSVMIPAKGHVESGTGTLGMLFPWEVVEKWNMEEEA